MVEGSQIKPWLLFGEGFILNVVAVNSARIMIRTHNKDTECNDSVRAVTDFIYRLSKIIQSTFPGGEDDPDELTGEYRVCVWRLRCLQ